MQLCIVSNAKYITKTSEYQVNRLVEECAKLGLTADVLVNNKPNVYGDNYTYDKCIFLDKDMYFAQLLENSGVRLYNSARAIQLTDDKAQTLLALQNKGIIVVPQTVFSPKIYTGEQSVHFLTQVAQKLEFPLVVKECYGSLGQQVYMAKNIEELVRISHGIGTNPHIYQSFQPASVGRSLRVYIVGGEVVGACRLINKNDFRSNFAVGGIMEKAIISNEQHSAAIKVAQALNLDFAGIDLFDTEEPMLIEVNSNAYFLGIEQLGFNVARAIARHIVEKE